MPEYIIAYHGGRKPASPEEGAQHRDNFNAWITGLGDAVVNPGTPLKGSRMVSSDSVSDDGGPDALTGFSIVKSDDMDAALELAKSCPFLDMGTIEVAEVMAMK